MTSFSKDFRQLIKKAVAFNEEILKGEPLNPASENFQKASSKTNPAGGRLGTAVEILRTPSSDALRIVEGAVLRKTLIPYAVFP